MNDKELEDLSNMFNPVIRGWAQHYGRFLPSALKPLWRHVNDYLVRWMQRKFKRLARGVNRASRALGRLAAAAPGSFEHWKLGCWRVSSSLRSDLALDALGQTRARRPNSPRDRGVQYLSIRYSERLAEAGLVASVGSVGDSYDNALAETVIGLFKTDVIRRRGPWRSVEDVELATLEWVHWFNTQRLLKPIGYVPPAEFELNYYQSQSHPAAVVGLT